MQVRWGVCERGGGGGSGTAQQMQVQRASGCQLQSTPLPVLPSAPLFVPPLPLLSRFCNALVYHRRLVLRCDGALLRRHVTLAPERCLALLALLLQGAQANR
jgi:hypothetical protein